MLVFVVYDHELARRLRILRHMVTSSRFLRAFLWFVMAALPEVELAHLHQEDVDIKRK